eukprot:CAMPEP_0119074962 /NCGR_PEP_ID=MMETSP1178-20130426/75470_1 /TAXON_ID=33656 /ORGANISM="unid sp, Strain CCMP2000" /LENGTH=127 /DNA_ID=CAMNT_0007057153 /DNA_START=32 /DNA_END=415 /DNA_ORIENTATION=-
MTMYRVLFLIVAVATASATVAPVAPSKFGSSKVLALRGGAKEVSEKNTITTENVAKIAAALFVWNNYVDGRSGIVDDTVGFFKGIPNWAKIVGAWWFLNEKEGDIFKGDGSWMLLVFAPLLFTGSKK